MNDNNNFSETASKKPLPVLICGAMISAIPQFFWVSFSFMFNYSLSSNFLLIPICGLALFFGYVNAKNGEKPTVVLWLGSLLYNLPIFLFCILMFLGVLFNIPSPLLLIPILITTVWFGFVVVTSARYLNHAVRKRSYDCLSHTKPISIFNP